jgi:hypothetical protein
MRMKINRFKVSAKKILQVPMTERVFLVYAGHMFNEVNILNRLIHFSNKAKTDTRIEREAKFAQLSILLRLIVGKLWESWECLEKIYFSTVLHKVYGKHFDQNTLQALNVLKTHFGKKSLLNTIRNKFAFHYSIDETRTWLNKPTKHSWVFNLGEEYGNTLFTYSEDVVMYTALEMINTKSPKRAFGKLLDESLLINKAFREFLIGAMHPIISKYFGKNLSELGSRKTTIKGARKFKSMTIPCFYEV